MIVDAGSSELLTPVDREIIVTTERRGASVVLTWTHPDYHARVFYRVLRTPGAEADAECTRDGVDWCRLQMLTLGTTREARFVDGSPPDGVTWRVAVATNYRDDEEGGDVFAVSPPVSAVACARTTFGLARSSTSRAAREARRPLATAGRCGRRATRSPSSSAAARR